MRLLLALSLLAATAHAQFTLQKSNTTASLRGVESVDGRVAWASGTAGTVLNTGRRHTLASLYGSSGCRKTGFSRRPGL
jgi:hypothetical protein